MIGLQPRTCFARGRCARLSAALFLTLSAPLGAAVLHVDDDNGTPVQQGSVQYPYGSLQAAIDQAANGDTIRIAAGTYGRIDNKNKALTLRGGYPGAMPTQYAAGEGGDFSQQDMVTGGGTVISGGAAQDGVTLTRNSADPAFFLVLDRLTVRESRKGIVCDTAVSWPHPTNITISNSLIENNGTAGEGSRGAGILICGENAEISDNTIRNNHGGRGPGISGGVGTAGNLLIRRNRIEDNVCYDDHGGGVYLYGPVTLEDNLIAGNRIEFDYGWGGGVFILGTAHMSRNIIRNNFAPIYGGGVFIDEGATAWLDHELIYHNRILVMGHGGAGVAVDNGAPGPSHLTLTNSTVAMNVAESRFGGNGLYVDSASSVVVKDCIFWGNGSDFFVREGSSLTVTYSLSQQGWNGAGNLSADPLFADPAGGDFHLRSTAGRYDPASGDWVIDTVQSPAIDVGDPAAAFAGEPAPNGARINLGAFGNTAQASRSGTPPPTRQLSVSAIGLSGDRIISTPPGIACGTACSAAFIAGTQVVLTATPAAGSTFAGWRGACQGPAAVCTLLLNENRATQAGFVIPAMGAWRHLPRTP